MILLEIPIGIECPQCRSIITNIKPITRSDTVLARIACVYIGYINMINILENDNETEASKKDALTKVFNSIVQNKVIFNDEKEFVRIVKKKLRHLYHEGWKPANLYYYYLFNEQIRELI